MKRWIILLAVCLLCFAAAGCGNSSASSGTSGTSGSENTTVTEPPVEELTMVVTEQTISQLEAFPDLKRVDLSGSTCYSAIASYMAAHPEVEVIYTVSLGGAVISSSTTSLTLEAGTFDYALLLQNLQYLPNLTEVWLNRTDLTAAEMAALQEASDLVRYTVQVGDVELTEETQQVDLSGLPADQVETAAQRLTLLPNLSQVELMTQEDTSPLSVQDVRVLQQALPNVTFHYAFDLFGQTLSLADTRVEFVEADIGDAGEEQIRAALDILTECEYFLLDNCGLSNEVLAQIRDDYPQTKVVWRIFQENKGRSWLTDTLVLRAVYGINNTNSGVLKYLTEVKYMDLGHNTSMTDLSFCAYMPDLEIAILSGSPITDLTPLANCKKLEFLEVAWCGHLKDISPLAQCDSLKYLNIGHTKVSDLSPIYGLAMEMLSYVNSGTRVGFTDATWAEIQSHLPNCWITYAPLADNNASPYGVGWRYKEGWKGYTDIYKKVREVFDYDYIDSLLKG